MSGGGNGVERLDGETMWSLRNYSRHSFKGSNGLQGGSAGANAICMYDVVCRMSNKNIQSISVTYSSVQSKQ